MNLGLWVRLNPHADRNRDFKAADGRNVLSKQRFGSVSETVLDLCCPLSFFLQFVFVFVGGWVGMALPKWWTVAEFSLQ